MKKPKLSQTHTRSGEGVVLMTFIAVAVDAVVLALLIHDRNVSFWIKAIFVVTCVLVTWLTVYQWRQRLQGCSVNMSLPQDPVPHGVPVIVEFQIDKPIRAEKWQVEAKIEESRRDQSGFGLVWSQDFTASQIEPHRIRAEVTLPNDYPSTAASDNDTTYRVALTLNANGLMWNW